MRKVKNISEMSYQKNLNDKFKFNAKYNLTADEIVFIESMIKPME